MFFRNSPTRVIDESVIIGEVQPLLVVVFMEIGSCRNIYDDLQGVNYQTKKIFPDALLPPPDETKSDQIFGMPFFEFFFITGVHEFLS